MWLSMTSKELRLKGDLQRELLFLIYLQNKYEKDNLTTSTLRRMAGYRGSGGIYSAINSLKNAGFVEEKNGNLTPTLKGKKYVKDNFLYTFDVIGMFGFLLIFIGLVFAYQWAMKVLFNIDIGLASPTPIIVFIAVGLFLRYGFLRLFYWTRRRT